MTSKENYFVFLDIDGTLWDWEYKLRSKSELLKPDSMKALNYLIDTLSHKFNVKIVMTSRRRQYFENACKLLYESGLDKKFTSIDKTPWEEGARGDKILDFMKNNGYKFPYENNPLKMKCLKLLKRKIFYNYVVLDDESDKIAGSIPDSKIINPNIYSNALCMQMVHKYLQNESLIEDVDASEK